MEIETIITRLDFIAKLIDETKVGIDKRFDNVDGEIKEIKYAMNEQKVINALQEQKIENCEKSVNGLGERLNRHLENHNVVDVKEMEEKTTMKNKVAFILGIGAIIVSVIISVVAPIIQAFITK